MEDYLTDHTIKSTEIKKIISNEEQSMNILEKLLTYQVQENASDLHLVSNEPSMIRKHGKLEPIIFSGKKMVLNSKQTSDLIKAFLSDNFQKQFFEDKKEVDLAYEITGLSRFRVNCYHTMLGPQIAFRAIPEKIPELEILQLPPVLRKIIQETAVGLVLVTGPTGSGKSTSLASMLNEINKARHSHIITIEDPIEYKHQSKNCLISQREVKEDTESFASALKYVLRQDPDIILVGEMRDPETIEAAITAAETGHLVFSTLHTQDAQQTVDRIIDSFPAGKQSFIRSQLSLTLKAVVSQKLIPTADKQSRIAACEVMIATPGIRNLIREGKTHQIYSQLQTSQQEGMQTMEAALAKMVLEQKISQETALNNCNDTKELKSAIIAGQNNYLKN